jgi:hypothetical protein
MGSIGKLPSITNQSTMGWSQSDGEPAIQRPEEFFQLDLGALGMRPERFGLEPAAGKTRHRMPDVLPQESGTRKSLGGQKRVRARIHVGDTPLVIASQECFVHPIQDLRRVAGQWILPEQHHEAIIGWVSAYLD